MSITMMRWNGMHFKQKQNLISASKSVWKQHKQTRGCTHSSATEWPYHLRMLYWWKKPIDDIACHIILIGTIENLHRPQYVTLSIRISIFNELNIEMGWFPRTISAHGENSRRGSSHHFNRHSRTPSLALLRSFAQRKQMGRSRFNLI